MLFKRTRATIRPVAGAKAGDLGIKLTGGAAASSGGGAKRTAAVPDGEVLQGYMDILSGAYEPETISYARQSDAALREQIEGWLRPSYDRAIAERAEQTAVYRAELDADAIARGMGASTYVTDVKSRQQKAEARDVALLETDYAAELAKNLAAAIHTENERVLEAEAFNAEAKNAAYLKAYDAALALFAAYKSQKATRSSGGKRSTAVKATTAENCERFLAGLTGAERREIYTGSTPQGAQYQAELIASVGTNGYIRYTRKYPISGNG